ncbi:DnaJ domain-containing protein [Paenibacillus sp. NPDC057934]|uniref:J domain-containing protein n=1 Tax=Paenibacillus sp. NPDC057934 TaxID=3346282 RepID=UPI0036D87A8F
MLGVSCSATADELKKAFRTKAKTYHPDVCKLPNAHEIFIEIAEAYEILRNPESRRNYDCIRKEESDHTRKQSDYDDTARNDYRETERKAKEQAGRYAYMTLEDLIIVIFNYSYETGRTLLIGERDMPTKNVFDYVKYGLIGILFTICIIITFTGIGTIPGAAFALLLSRGLRKDDSFIGLGPFLLCTLVADVVVLIVIFSILSNL